MMNMKISVERLLAESSKLQDRDRQAVLSECRQECAIRLVKVID